MKISTDFLGGNILIKGQDGDTFYLDCELRDTEGEWFYWAFCAQGFEGRTIKFVFEKPWIGYFGPAISSDLNHWEWLNSGDDHSFEYTFGENEDKVYFAHHLLYHPDRFASFARKHGLEIKEFCNSRKGRSVPMVEFGEGDRLVILAARHHACESTGSYALEGTIEGLIKNPINNLRYICVPFVDYDGVVDGDQGKNRFPHDHNRDYPADAGAIYPEVKQIREIADNNDVFLAFSFHSPWHKGGLNDKAFLPQMTLDKLDRLVEFGNTFESCITQEAFKYEQKNDYPPNTDWNKVGMPCFETYLLNNKGNYVTTSVELAYFGEYNNRITQDNTVEFGRCFAKAMKKYVDIVDSK
ncbi:MAG: hypothetical protein PHE51_01355 [Eubacteriales bacterium]|nr:hypothetical protein [Eubacteriales bacterium]